MKHICQQCGIPFEAKRNDARFHSAACRARSSRGNKIKPGKPDAEKLITSVHKVMITVATMYEEAAARLRKLYIESLP